MDKRKAPGLPAEGPPKNLDESNKAYPTKYVNTETGEIAPLVQAPPGTRKVSFRDREETGEEFCQLYPVGMPADLDLALSPLANIVLRYMEQNLCWGNNMVLEGTTKYATYETLAKRYKKSVIRIRHVMMELERQGLIQRITGLHRKTFFLVSPHYIYRGYLETRQIVIASFDGCRGGEIPASIAEINATAQRVRDKEAEIKKLRAKLKKAGKVVPFRQKAGN